MQVTVGIRDLKTHLSKYLRQVQTGHILIVTERGKPVARITPVEKTLEEKMEELAQAGFLSWSGELKKLKPTPPVAVNKGDKTVSDMVLEDRE